MERISFMTNRTRFTSLILTALLLLPCLAACGSSPAQAETTPAVTEASEITAVTETTGPCTHTYAETESIPAKALTDGSRTMTCSLCGDAYTETVPATKSLKVLAIGNSFSVDAMEFLWHIAKNSGVETVVLGNLYIGSCSLDKHAGNIQKNAADYKYYKNTAGSWTTRDSTTVEYGLKDEDWDIITVQQASGSSGAGGSYSRLDYILEYITENKPEAEIYWHMTWAYQQDSTHSDFSKYGSSQTKMFDAILKTVNEQVKPKEAIDGIIPAGTALQNLRASSVGDTVTRDGYHLSRGIGRYTAGLTWFSYITGVSPDQVEWFPQDYVLDIRPHLDEVREAVKSAIAAPENYTLPKAPDPSVKNPETDEEYLAALGKNIEDYELLDWALEVQAYYNSTSSAHHNELISKANSTANNLPNFIASHTFTKEQLPVGSVILLDKGYEYRPEGWVDEKLPRNASSVRPAKVSSRAVEVTEEWWGNFAVRAFNLGSSPSAAMTEDDISHLRIYVPKGTK